MGISRRIDEARKAFDKRDIRAAGQAHTEARIKAKEEHLNGRGKEYLGEMVYGGLDGIITTFAVVSGVAGGQLGPEIVLMLGFANLLADGFSMGTGSYLSTKSEQEYYQREWSRELWEVEHFPDGERSELQEVYEQQGYTSEEAQKLVGIQSQTPERWVNAMMLNELGMMKDSTNPLYNGIVTFIAFVVAGIVPLLVYLLGVFMPIPEEIVFPVSLVLSGMALFGLGAARVLVTDRNLFRSGLEMLIVGGLAAAVAYGVGAFLRSLGLGG